MLGTADLAKRLGRVGILPVYPRNSRMNPKRFVQSFSRVWKVIALHPRAWLPAVQP